jgi:tetratricopeptide (TPR) repeat protein
LPHLPIRRGQYHTSQVAVTVASTCVFRGGFDLAAFAAILFEGDELAALDALQVLCDQQLVSVVELPPGSGRRRYFPSDTPLFDNDDRLRLRHAEYFAGQPLDRLELERENLAAARELALGLGTPRGMELGARAQLSLESLFGGERPGDGWHGIDCALLPDELAAEVWLSKGRASGDAEALNRAVALAENAGRSELVVAALIETARLLADTGKWQEAENVLERARPLAAPSAKGRILSELAELHAARGRPEAALELEQRALGDALASADHGREANARKRVAMRMRALGLVESAREHEEEARELLGESAPPAYVLRVSDDVRSVELAPGPRLELERRPSVKRVLAALIEARQTRAGQGVSIGELFEAGWPGDAIRPESRAARVYVAINTLRKLGFAPVLLRQDDGYLLTPALRVETQP